MAAPHLSWDADLLTALAPKDQPADLWHGQALPSVSLGCANLLTHLQEGAEDLLKEYTFKIKTLANVREKIRREPAVTIPFWDFQTEENIHLNYDVLLRYSQVLMPFLKRNSSTGAMHFQRTGNRHHLTDATKVVNSDLNQYVLNFHCTQQLSLNLVEQVGCFSSHLSLWHRNISFGDNPKYSFTLVFTMTHWIKINLNCNLKSREHETWVFLVLFWLTSSVKEGGDCKAQVTAEVCTTHIILCSEI